MPFDLPSLLTSLPRRAAHFLLGGRCLLCDCASDAHAASGPLSLCQACLAELPKVLNPCPQCAMPMQNGIAGLACGSCARKRLPIDAIRAVQAYQRPFDDLILRFKHGHDLACGRLLAQLMMESARAWTVPDCLIPVPLHPDKLCERGFDQAELLSIDVAIHLQIPWRRALQRVRATPSQAGLSKSARQKNLQGAFVARDIRGLTVALIDDVATTGSTLSAAAIACKRAGALRVEAWVLARA